MSSCPAPDQVSASLLLCDGLCLVINKPAGWAVHSGQGRHLGSWLPLLRQGRSANPEIAHRLDRDTTGCLVLGRHPKALRKLHQLFSQGQVHKVYWAIVVGRLVQSQGFVDLALSERESVGALARVRPDPQGKPARTEYRVLREFSGLSWVELRPLTGRTHQLRAHMAALGCPIKGDSLYGGGSGAMLLHARSISLPLYPRKPPLLVEAPLPESWRSVGLGPAGDDLPAGG